MENTLVYKGLTQSDYQRTKVLLENFKLVECDWKELFRWILSVGREIDFYDKEGNKKGKIADLWQDHVLTILMEILQKDVEGAIRIYKQDIGTNKEQEDINKLKEEIEAWISRLQRYIDGQIVKRQDTNGNYALQVAHSIHDRLSESLLVEIVSSSNIEFKPFYKMLKAINEVKEKEVLYIQLIEKNGDMDPALSLLLTYIRSYSAIVKRFDQSFSHFPEFYHHRLLKIAPKKVVQDKVLLIIAPEDPSKGFFLPPYTQFLAGKKEDGSDLLYRTEKSEYISGMKIEEAFTVFWQEQNKKKTLYKKNINLDNLESHTSLFLKDEGSTDYPYGWMLESRILLLKEGARNIKINFILHPSSNLMVQENIPNAFSVYVSDAQGWSLKKHVVNVEKSYLSFEIELKEEERPMIPATVNVHRVESQYPIVRILGNNQNSPLDWTDIMFQKVEIEVNVEHVHDFNQCNELGRVDTSQPFYPFGTQAEHGAWFKFGNEEMTQKKISRVVISGVWNRLPPTKDYEDIYKEYSNGKITNASFKIKCERQENNRWVPCSNSSQGLFLLDDSTKLLSENIKLVFETSGQSFSRSFTDLPVVEQNPDKFCILRATLSEPVIGFGVEEYRKIFAERMIYNSQHSSNPKPLPAQPLIPIMADMELQYEAKEIMNLSSSDLSDAPIRLSRVSALTEYEFLQVKGVEQKFVAEETDGQLLYLGISNALHKKSIRMYFDLVFVASLLEGGRGGDRSANNSKAELKWSYLYNGQWTTVDAKDKFVDKTGGFTQRGYVEFELPLEIDERSLDQRSLFWLRAYVNENGADCLPLRSIYMDNITVVAENGDGRSLPAGTIKELQKKKQEVRSVFQPLPGYDGREVESVIHSSVRQSYRIANRNRASLPLDYEQMILEQFPDVLKACFIETENAMAKVNVVVFSYTEDNIYPITPIWQLTKIKNYLESLVSPLVTLRVINPLYKKIDIEFVAEVNVEVVEGGEMKQRIINIFYNYFAAWLQRKNLPELGQRYSYKKLYNLLEHEKNVTQVYRLKVDNKSIEHINEQSPDIYIYDERPECVLVPNIKTLELLLINGGIGCMKIECNFKVAVELK